MTFKIYNLSPKRPHLHRSYVLGVCNNLGTTVHGSLISISNDFPVNDKDWSIKNQTGSNFEQ